MECRSALTHSPVFAVLSVILGAVAVATALSGCPPPAETRDAAAVDAGAILTQLEKQGEGLLESWTWEYRVTPEPRALLPEGFDGARFEAACARLGAHMSPAARAKMRTPKAAELILLRVDPKAETYTWLDPEQHYANEGPFIELHAFTRYRTRASGELLAREFVQRVGSHEGVLEAVTVQDAATGVARASVRDRSGETVHDYPEAAFTPWAFGLSFDPKPLGQRPAGVGLAEWRLELATQASDPDAAGGPSEAPVLLRLRQWRRGGDQDWAATLGVVRLPDLPTAYPAQMAWHRDAALVARVSVDAWLPPTAGHDAMLVPSLARRTAPTSPGTEAAEQTVRYHLTAFGPSRENPISASAARKAIESMRAVLETWGDVPSVPVSLGGDPATDPSVDAIRELYESRQEQGGT